MRNNFCYYPEKGIDDVIAEKINGLSGSNNWTPHRVAMLRGLHDESESTPLDVSNLDNAAENLLKFRSTFTKRTISKVNKVFNRKAPTSKELTKLHKKLKKVFGSEERYNRISMISTIFSDIVDDIQEDYPELSRETICKGVVIDGEVIGGQSIIFSRVFNTIMSYYEEALTEGDGEKSEKYKNIIDNFDALASYARMRLRDTEGLKLGEKLQFVDETNADSYSEFVNSFELEESKREAWQEENDKISSFGSISKGVRKLIGTISKYDENGEVYDDLDFPIMLDPISVHQTLCDILIGVSSESHLMAILNSELESYPWLRPIIEELNSNSRLRTQFYVDFHKGFQLYSQIGVDKSKTKNGILHWRTTILNKIVRNSLGKLLTRVTQGDIITSDSTYDKDGNTNWENLGKLNDIIKEYFSSDNSTNVFTLPKILQTNNNTPVVSWADKRTILKNVLNSLGIDVSNQTLNILVNPKNTTKLRSLVREIGELSSKGITPIFKAELQGEVPSGKQPFITTIDVHRESITYTLKEGYSKIFKVLDTVGERNYERRARYKDNKGKSTSYDSYVTPSYMSDVFGAIHSFVKNNDKEGLQNYIENRFLTSSYFYDKRLQVGDKINPEAILNQWLKDLYTSKLEDAESVASNFSFERFLGDEDHNVFENFTSKQHLITVMEMYFSDKQISPKSKYAHYPVFILGDSGVAKFIKAKRYSSKEILDGMYKVFLQERRRMELTKAANKQLKEDGHGKISSFSDKAEKYSILTFLNEERYAKMIDPNHYEQSVKNAIKAYMEESVTRFKSNMEALRILETKTVIENNKEVTKYVYLNQDATPESIDRVIADFYWNSKFAMINQLQLFTIDPAFYKGTEDLQKRYKEIHAPGTALSLEAEDFDGNLYSEDGIERCLYFDDIKLPAKEDFINALEQNDKTRAYVGKYLDNTLTDGQGYRTLDSYRKVLGMAGIWSEDHEKAYNTIKEIRRKNNGAEISKEDLAKIAELSVVFQPIKPYMFTHEHFKVNDNDELLIPVQHKYSEIVLIPELLPNSTLKDLAYYMEKHNIDMVGSTTIVKVGNFGAASISNVKNAEELENELSKGRVHQLSYADYRIQSNVPDHLNGEQLFGTQARKLFFHHINYGKDYSAYVGGKRVNLGNGRMSTLNGRNLISLYNSLHIANIIESFNIFESQASDPSKLSEMMIQNTISNSRDPMDLVFSYSQNEDGTFGVPLFEGELAHSSSATLFSIFKKIVNKQRIKGGSAVQASAYGLTDYNEKEDLQFVVDPNNPNNILYAECELAFNLSYTDSEGKNIPLKFEDWCNPDGTLILGGEVDVLDPDYFKCLAYRDAEGKVRRPKIEEKFPGILSFIAYRIPTEREYSMINMQIKRFTPNISGGIIKVPVQGTTISGFDFDIDKLYFMMREYVSTTKEDPAIDQLIEGIFGIKPLEFQEYDFEKSPLDNTRVARNNLLIDLCQQRLMDYDTFEGRYTPGGFSEASKSARRIRELMFGNPEGLSKREDSSTSSSINFEELERRANEESDPKPNYDPTDIMTLVTYNQQNQVAGKLIGIFANQNVNHAFSSLMSSFKLKKPISFCGHSYMDLLNAPDGRDVNANTAELLSASVDAVKDPVLNYLNLNTLTADAGAVLARLGYNTFEIGLLFNQPIIKDICEYAFNNRTSLEVATSTIIGQYNKIAGNNAEGFSQNKNSALTQDALAKNILNERILQEKGKNARENSKFAQGQLIVAELFGEINHAANDVNRFVTSSKFTASNAVGSSFGDFYAQQMRVKEYINHANANKLAFTVKVADNINTTINNSSESIELSDDEYMLSLLKNPFGYEQAMFDMNRKVEIVLSKYFPYKTPVYIEVRNLLSSLTKSGTLDADTINSIHTDLLAYMLSNQEKSLFYGNQLMNIEGDMMTAREYYTKRFVKRLYNEIKKNPELKSFMILSEEYAQFITDMDTGELSLQISNHGGLQSYQKDAIIESWEELSEQYPVIARDLFLYNFYKTGFNFGPFNFMNLTPTAVKQVLKVTPDTTYIDFLNKVKRGDIQIDINDFAKQWILNHLDNTSLVFYPKGDALEIVKKRYKDSNNKVLPNFDLNLNELEEKDQSIWVTGKSESGNLQFRPCIVIGGIPYIANGDVGFNTSSGTSMRYEKHKVYGMSHKTLAFYTPAEPTQDLGIIEDTSFAGSSSIEPEIPKADASYNREEAIQSIATQLDKAYRKANLRDEQGEFFSLNTIIEILNDKSDEELQQEIEDIKRACKENGILVLDEEGNLMENC